VVHVKVTALSRVSLGARLRALGEERHFALVEECFSSPTKARC
jgi:hypothetical protein